MSKASKVILGASGLFAIGFFGYVNGKQWFDKKKMNEAVMNDIQRQAKRKTENLYWLEKQIEMKNIIKKHQDEDQEIALKLLGNSKKDGI